MSLQKEQTDKLYYSISEVSDMFEVNASTIRFWEKEFDILKPTKNKKGNRLFTQKDIENLRLIVHYVKEKGYTLSGAKDALKNGSPELDNVKLEVIEKLKQIKDKLNDIKSQL
ncbi:MAG: MerR family transcriptional regulator [Bacteroidia bacterium]|nr:MerR family transcriptional regulator [Bacteroidia bacterium]